MRSKPAEAFRPTAANQRFTCQNSSSACRPLGAPALYQQSEPLKNAQSRFEGPGRPTSSQAWFFMLSLLSNVVSPLEIHRSIPLPAASGRWIWSWVKHWIYNALACFEDKTRNVPHFPQETNSEHLSRLAIAVCFTCQTPPRKPPRGSPAARSLVEVAPKSKAPRSKVTPVSPIDSAMSGDCRLHLIIRLGLALADSQPMEGRLWMCRCREG